MSSVSQATTTIVQTWRAARTSVPEITEGDVWDPLERFETVWDELFPTEQARIVQLLVERVDPGSDGAEIRLRTGGPASLIADLHGRGHIREAA